MEYFCDVIFYITENKTHKNLGLDARAILNSAFDTSPSPSLSATAMNSLQLTVLQCSAISSELKFPLLSTSSKSKTLSTAKLHIVLNSSTSNSPLPSVSTCLKNDSTSPADPKLVKVSRNSEKSMLPPPSLSNDLNNFVHISRSGMQLPLSVFVVFVELLLSGIELVMLVLLFFT